VDSCAVTPDGSTITVDFQRGANACLTQEGPGDLALLFTSTQHAVCPTEPGSACERVGPLGELYVMHPNGARQTRITFDNVPQFGAQLSPDGTRIAFHRPVGPFGQITSDRYRPGPLSDRSDAPQEILKA